MRGLIMRTEEIRARAKQHEHILVQVVVAWPSGAVWQYERAVDPLIQKEVLREGSQLPLFYGEDILMSLRHSIEERGGVD